MLILHAAVQSGELLVWAESSTDSVSPDASTSGHPYDVSGPRLAEILTEMDHDIGEFAPTETLYAWLPTAAGRPIPSSPLLGDRPSASAKIALQPWAVRVLRLKPKQTVDLLTACIGRETATHGVRVGPSLAYWSAALRFACALAGREQFVPSVRKEGTTWAARWTPVLAGAEGQRAATLAHAMPAACRALSRSESEQPTTPAADVLEAFLRTTVDVLVRSAAPQRSSRQFDSVHDQWLNALAASDGTLRGSEDELAALDQQVRSWQRPVLGISLAPFRLCFRLEEPTAEKDPWNVRYLLQARDDPSLLLPASEGWEPKRAAAAVFKQREFKPREFLLTALGQATTLCPPVEMSLKAAAPGGFTTDATGAHRFLTEYAWLLEQAGYGVLLPAWWTPGRTKVRVAAQAHVRKRSVSSGVSLGDVLQFDWKAAIGDQVLDLKELRALAKLKEPLVQIRGQWVEIRPDELQAVLELAGKRAASKATVRELLQMAVGAVNAPGDVPITSVEGEGSFRDLLDRLEGRVVLEDLDPPQGLQATLRPYQVRGYSWIAFLRQWGLGACLADDMGLGKTLQTLTVLQREWHEGRRSPTLLVCPTSVLGNWQREAERFTPDLPVLLHHGPKRLGKTAFAKQAKTSALVLTSYALLHRDAETLQKVKWGSVVLDEAQNIKNAETKQAQGARALMAEHRLALTGTPVENHVGDLWSIFEFLNPGLLGPWATFRKRFFIPIQAGRDTEAASKLKRLTGPFILRRLKTDRNVISDLPDKVEMKVFCTLTKEQASLYAAVVEDMTRDISKAEGIQRRGRILAALAKLKQVCNHPAHFLGDHSALNHRSGKLERLTELLEEIGPTGERVLLFTQFTEMGELLRRYLQEESGREVLFLHGGLPRKQRDALVARFQADGGPQVFVLSLKAGGTGLNLTAGNHVVHFDRWWNPAVENQATDRAFRIGQTRKVLVHKFVCIGTVEEKIDAMIERKKEIAGSVVGDEGWITEMSDTQLRDLFALRDEALGGGE